MMSRSVEAAASVTLQGLKASSHELSVWRELGTSRCTKAPTPMARAAKLDAVWLVQPPSMLPTQFFNFLKNWPTSRAFAASITETEEFPNRCQEEVGRHEHHTPCHRAAASTAATVLRGGRPPFAMPSFAMRRAQHISRVRYGEESGGVDADGGGFNKPAFQRSGGAGLQPYLWTMTGRVAELLMQKAASENRRPDTLTRLDILDAC